MTTRMNFHKRKAKRREEAIMRQEFYDSQLPKAKIRRAEMRRGESKKEIARLTA